MAPPEEPNQPNGAPQPMGARCKAKPRDFREGDDFSMYISHFERVAGANGWTDQEKLVYLETMLRGKAQREFEVFIEETPAITWKDMITKLKRELVPSKQKSLDSFSQLRMDGKSPRELYASLVRLSNLAHGEMNEAARHIIVRAQLIQAIPKSLREDASKHQELSQLEKDDLLNLLTRIYEAGMKEADEASYEPVICHIKKDMGKRPNEDRIEKLEKENKQLKDDISEIKEMMKGLYYTPNRGAMGRGSSSFRPRQSNRDGPKCYRCQRYGHFQRDCRNPETCTFCGGEGHRYSTCPEYPKN